MTMDITTLLTLGFLPKVTVQQKIEAFLSGNIDALFRIQDPEVFQKTVVKAKTAYAWLSAGENKHVIWAWDKNYPCYGFIERNLPFMLFVHGELPPPSSETVTIVGTRKAQQNAVQSAFKLGLELSMNERFVASGLAYGIDQSAQLGAIEAQKPSWCVLGCGIEVNYPTYAGSIKRRILKFGGGLISQFHPTLPALKGNFPNRNVTLAALADKTVVIQAPKRSGSLITADFALQMGRDVYVSSAGVGNGEVKEGTNALALDGAPVVENVLDLFPNAENLAHEGRKGVGKNYRFCEKYYIVERR